ncbi:hypothetical protein C8Q70DRAFT_404850 [Cubamyces menziesii]|nr:hypothetical protein C8Q70DRAFT_404850 [Cubamyces menziesii]
MPRWTRLRISRSDKQREIRPPPAVQGQPLLQPRPQPAPNLQPQAQPQQQPAAPQPSQQQQQQPQQQRVQQQQSRPQPSPIPQAQHAQPPQVPTIQSPHPPQSAPSPYLALGHSTTPINLMNVGFQPAPLSPPTVPDPLNPFDHVPKAEPPHARLPPGTHDAAAARAHFAAGNGQAARPGAHTHAHAHAGQPGQAAHVRQGQHTHIHAGQPGHAAGSQTQTQVQPLPPPNLALRGQYQAAMQMHHVPHPHAHARHHASHINRTERLYGAPEHTVMNISAEGIKGDMQRRGSDLLHFPGAAANQK